MNSFQLYDSGDTRVLNLDLKWNKYVRVTTRNFMITNCNFSKSRFNKSTIPHKMTENTF